MSHRRTTPPEAPVRNGQVDVRRGVALVDAQGRFIVHDRFVDIAVLEKQVADIDDRRDAAGVEFEGGDQFPDRALAIAEPNPRNGELVANHCPPAVVRGFGERDGKGIQCDEQLSPVEGDDASGESVSRGPRRGKPTA